MTARTVRRCLVLAAAVVVLAGCSVTNEITTQNAYEPSDGVRVDLGAVRAGNLLVVAAEEGGPGAVVGYLTNSGGDAVRVTVAPEGAEGADGADGAEGVGVRVPGGGTVLLGPDHEAVELAAVPAPPGGTVTLRLAVEDGRTATARVPVLDGTFGEYADLVPAGEE